MPPAISDAAVRSLIAQWHEGLDGYRSWIDGSTDGTARGQPRASATPASAHGRSAKCRGCGSAQSWHYPGGFVDATPCSLDADDWLAPRRAGSGSRGRSKTTDATAVYEPVCLSAGYGKAEAAPLWVKSGPFPEKATSWSRLLLTMSSPMAAMSCSGGRSRGAKRAFWCEVAFGKDWESWVRLRA